jgi:hypothetical protein
LVALVGGGSDAQGVKVNVNGEVQKLPAVRFHTTISKFCPLGTVNEYEVIVLVPLPRSPRKLVQTLPGLKLGEYAALKRLTAAEALHALSKLTV